MKKNTFLESGISRRKFVAGTAASLAAFSIVPSHVLGGDNGTPPSEKLNIVAVGAGGMAAANINACANENIIALCDVDSRRAAGTFKKFPKAKVYKDFRRMLKEQKKHIDAVIVATPDHIHAVAAMAAMKEGKHVYVQKPLTRSVYEARMLTETAREYGVITQMGNQGHSGEGCRLVKEWIADGAIGAVKDVHCFTNRPVWPQGMRAPENGEKVPKTLDWDLWLGPAADRPYHDCYMPFNWRGWIDFGGGALGDMGCHVMDAAFWALDLKYPSSVQASHSTRKWGWNSTKETGTFPDASVVHYTFPARGDWPKVKLHWYDGGLRPDVPEFFEASRSVGDNGTIFVGEKGCITCGTYGENPRLVPETLRKSYTKPAKTLERIHTSHEQNWINACKGGKPACSNFDYSGPFTETVLMGNLAVRNPNKLLLWDGENMKVTNDPAADMCVNEPYRKGWSL